MRIFVLTLMLLFSMSALAQASYIDDRVKTFGSATTSNDEALLWATCSATYDVYAELIKESKPNTAKSFSNRGNGAQLAVTMSQVAELILSVDDGDLTDFKDRFDSVWIHAKMIGDSMPETEQTRIMSDFELKYNGDARGWIMKLNRTLEICTENIDAQERYIQLWRTMVKNGMFEVKDNAK